MSDGYGTARFLENVKNHRAYNHVNADSSESKDVLVGKRSLSALQRRLLIILLSAISVVCLASDNEAAAEHMWWHEPDGCDFEDTGELWRCHLVLTALSAIHNMASKSGQSGIMCDEAATACTLVTAKPGGGGIVTIFRSALELERISPDFVSASELKRVSPERFSLARFMDHPGVKESLRRHPNLEGPIGR